MKLVIFPAIDNVRLQKVSAAAGAMQVVNCDSAERAHSEIVDADAFYGKMSPKLLAAAKQLRWVQSPTASLEHYLFPELIEHPCELSNMRGLFSDVIADHVLGYVLCFARNLHTYLRLQDQARWAPIGEDDETTSFATGPSQVREVDRRHLHLADCTLGVVGVGAIGSEICRRAAAFGMTVLGVDPHTKQVAGAVDEVWRTDLLNDLLAASDFVVIAAPHTPETFKLFRTPQFEAMQSTAYLINIGRGVIVDLADLTQALRQKQIAGAGLDVFETEPLPAEHPLWSMPNVIITPHIAAASPRVSERHLATLLENIRRFANGESPTTLVNKDRWY